MHFMLTSARTAVKHPPTRRLCRLEQVRLIAHIKQNHPCLDDSIKKAFLTTVMTTVDHFYGWKTFTKILWEDLWFDKSVVNMMFYNQINQRTETSHCISKGSSIFWQVLLFFNSYFMLLWFIALIIELSSCHINGDLWGLAFGASLIFQPLVAFPSSLE